MCNEPLDYEVLSRLVKCIHDTVGFGRRAFNKLSLATDVARDLGIDGDDATDLMAEFSARFGTDMNGYDAYRYFVPEGYGLFSFRRDKSRRGNIPLRLGMLYAAAKSGTWDAQMLESTQFSTDPLYRRTEDIPVEGYRIRS